MNKPWTYEVTAKRLFKSSSCWKIFFNTDFKTPRELLEAIPRDSKKSIATITNYYVDFNYANKRRGWTAYSCAVVFYTKHPKEMEIIMEGTHFI